ncbi:MAG: hypothetical protein IJ418_07400 [Clostridia bacterium]|nr:hypothetical protein [Clostridia bacterium]
MKKMIAVLLALLLMLPAMAFAQGSVLLVELEEDAQMVENVAFEDGDFIQTYQLSGGAHVQLLRYASFDMNLGDLIASEWVGATDMRVLEVSEISGYPAQGLRFAYQEEGQDALDVTLVVVDANETLVFSAVYPKDLGTAQIDAAVEAMLGSMSVSAEGEEAVDSTAEVG